MFSETAGCLSGRYAGLEDSLLRAEPIRVDDRGRVPKRANHMTRRVECLWIGSPRGILALMSLNVALPCQSTPQSPTCSSIASIDDDVNNPAARVYFGPIQSPEKLLIAQATHKRNNLSSMPVRRSPRLSALQSSQQPASSSEEEGRPVEATSRGKVGPRAVSPSVTPAPDEDSTQDGKNSCFSTLTSPEISMKT